LDGQAPYSTIIAAGAWHPVQADVEEFGLMEWPGTGSRRMDAGAVTGVFVATYALSDAEVDDVMAHIGRTIGTIA
jgi:hypothetical protein